MKLLPWTWWKLGFQWLTGTRSRGSQAKRRFLGGSLGVAVWGLALGVSVLSLTRALVSGFERTLAEGVQRSQGSVVHFLPWQTFKRIGENIKAAPEGWQSAQIFWSAQGLVVGPNGGKGVRLEGRSAWPQTERPPATEVEVTLGKPLADYLGAQQGGQIRLLLPEILKTPLVARVTGIVNNGVHIIDSRLVLVDDKSLRDVLQREHPDAMTKRPGDGHAIRYFLKGQEEHPLDLKSVETWRDAYRKKLVDARLLRDEPQLSTWRELRTNLFGAIDHDRQTLSFIIALLTLVAGLNVAASLLVLFLERDREMAMLQALGLSRSQFMQWLGIQGLLVGGIASVLGLLLARVLGFVLVRMPFARIPADIYNIERLPLYFEFGEQGFVFAFGVGVSFAVALLLGWRMGRVSLLSVLGQRR